MANQTDNTYHPVLFKISIDKWNPFTQIHEGRYAFLSDALSTLEKSGIDITKITTAEFFQDDRWNAIEPAALQGEIQYALQQGGRL